MGPQRDVLIIGGGVIGLTTAYYLALDGVQVAVTERGEFGREASWAGAGIIYPGNFARATTPFNRLLAYSVSHYPALSAELLDRTGIDNGYRVCGGFELQSGVTEAMVRTWVAEGITFEHVPRSELRRVEPALADDLEDAWYQPDVAQVRNPRHLQALMTACRELGVELIPQSSVRGLRRVGDRFAAVTTDEGELTADRFLIAAGAWSDLILQPLGIRLGIVPVRGQIVLFNQGRAVMQKIVSQGKDYLVPRADGRVLAGATEEDAGYVKETTAEALDKLTRFAHRLVPALRRAPVETTWAGLRPGTRDELPFLGRVPGADNLFVAAGHFRSGLMLSPGTGRLMADLLTGRPPALALDAFSLDRSSR